MQRFPHAADTRAGGSEGNAGTLVLLLIPAGTEAELEAAAAEEIEGGGLLGQEGRMAVVVGKDNAADSQRGGNGRGDSQGRHRGERIEKVVGHDQRGIAVGFGAASLLFPVAPVSRVVREGSETKWA